MIINKHIYTQLYITIPVAVTLFMIASIIAIVFTTNLSFDFSHNGFSTFMEIFKLPLSCVAFLTIYFTFLISFERMELQSKQLNEIKLNNDLTNFFKHRDEFCKFVKKSELFMLLEETTSIDLQGFQITLYSDFYSDNYTAFVSTINENMEKFIRHFDNYLLSVKDENVIEEYDTLFNEYCLNCDKNSIPGLLGYVGSILSDWSGVKFANDNKGILYKALIAEIINIANIFDGQRLITMGLMYNYSGFFEYPKTFTFINDTEKRIATFFSRNSIMKTILSRK